MENDSKTPSGLSVLMDLPFEVAEQARIVDFLKENPATAKKIKDAMARTSHFKDFVNKTRFKVPGFRPGSPHYNQKATERIFEHLSSEHESNKLAAWSTYTQSFVNYLRNNRQNLAIQLTNLKPGSNDSPEQIFRTICSTAVEFDVSKEEISEFYQLSWVPRFASFDSFLSLISAPDPQIAIARKVEKIEKSFLSVSEKIDVLNSNFSAALGDAKDDIAAEQKAQLEELSESIRNLKPELSPDLEEKVEKLQGQVSGAGTSLTKITEALDELSESLEEKTNSRDIRTDLKKVIEAVKESAEALNEGISSDIKSIETLVSGLRTDIEAKTTAVTTTLAKVNSTLDRVSKSVSGTDYTSPLASKPTFSHVPYKVQNETDFISSWSARSNPDNLYTPEELLAIHCVLLSSKTVVTTNSKLVQGWLETMGLTSATMDIAPSPNWNKEQDWADGAAHLFIKSPSSRVLIMHSYDSGFPESYLVPSLIKWDLAGNDDGNGKLILTSDGTEHPCHELLARSSYVQRKDPYSFGGLGLEKPIKLNRYSGNSGPMGVEPRFIKEWAQHGKKVNFNFDPVHRILEADIPPHLIDQFHKTASCLLRHFLPKDASAIALKHLILPWVLAKFGEATCADLLTHVEFFL